MIQDCLPLQVGATHCSVAFGLLNLLIFSSYAMRKYIYIHILAALYVVSKRIQLRISYVYN